jgi:hypothetical protein
MGVQMMSLTLELSLSEERRLRDAAQRCGIAPEQLARQLFSQLRTASLQVETMQLPREEMTEERRDWDNVTRR